MKKKSKKQSYIDLIENICEDAFNDGRMVHHVRRTNKFSNLDIDRAYLLARRILKQARTSNIRKF